MRRLLLFPLRALTNRERREQRKQKTPLLSVVVYCGYDAVSKGSVCCACVKSKQKDAFGCEERFSKNFSLLFASFSVVSSNWAIFWSLYYVSGLLPRAMILSTCSYVLNAWVCAFLRRYKVTKSFVLFSLSLSLTLTLFYSVGLLLAPTFFFRILRFFMYRFCGVCFLIVFFSSLDDFLRQPRSRVHERI